MSSASLRELVDLNAIFLPLTVGQYHRMIQTGVLVEGEPYELLDGHLIRKDRSKAGEDPMSVGFDHAGGVDNVADLNPKFQQLGCYVRVQQPVTLPPDGEPDPDGAVVRGTRADYRGRHPGPGDVTCAIEVADSSLRLDRTTKLRIYADAGIPQYLIVNLVDGVVEEHRQSVAGRGRYAASRTFARGDTVRIDAANGQYLDVPVDQMLP